MVRVVPPSGLGHLEFVVDLDGEAPVIRVDGELDLTGAASIRHCIEAVRLGQLPVIVDLEGATFVDCRGIAALLQARSACAEWGSTVILRCPSSAVRRVLEVTEVSDLFAVEA